MKFHVLFSQGPNPPAEAVDDLASASMEWVSNLTNDGKIETTYLFPDGGGFAVFNADSAEELQELLHSNPSSSYLRHDARACLEVTPGLDKLRESFGETLKFAAERAGGRGGGGGGGGGKK